MKKKIFIALLAGLLLFGLYAAFRYYRYYSEQQRRASYYENLEDSASPTVTVLRDSIPVDYRNEKKTIHVYVPPEYNRDTTKRFPVIYMLDGESSFNDMEFMGPEWQIDEVINAADARQEPSAIVIGINQAEDRDAEYTPFINKDNPNAHGAEFSKWVVRDLKSWVDSTYRTIPDVQSTTIGGISRSGMMAYYMMMTFPDVFGKSLIQSPAMWVDYDRLIDMRLSDQQLRNKKIFISVGEHEGGIMVPHARAIFEKFKARGLENDRLRFEIISGEGHLAFNMA